MEMKAGERWHCTNTACRCSVLVERAGELEGNNPVCVCGSVMKKQYTPAVFQHLNFLRFPEPVIALHEPSED